MLSILLLPFAWLYGMVTRIRNILYDTGLLRSQSFSPAVISIGNLSVGGTGKTPMIEYLVNLLERKFTVAILSRGYGRVTRGFLMAEKHDDATTIGDEPFQFYRKFGSRLPVAVSESRVEGITKLIRLRPKIQVVLLDDAFQHRAVRPLFSILLSDFSRPFFRDHLLPQGRLREPRDGAARADALVITKCKTISSEIENDFRLHISRYAGQKPIFFSAVGYQSPKPMDGETQIGKNVILVTGIANSGLIADYVSLHFTMIDHFTFNDHHKYTVEEIKRIQTKAGNGGSILTTEKDFVKLISTDFRQVIERKLWFYLPIEPYFLNRGLEFDELILMKTESHLRSIPTQNLD